jgi:TPR repeat protein
LTIDNLFDLLLESHSDDPIDSLAFPSLRQYWDSIVNSSPTPESAAQSFKTGSNQNHLPSRVAYSICLLEPFGLPQHINKAKSEMKIAAKSGSADAQVYHGLFNFKDSLYAAKYFSRAAQQKHPFGQFLLGFCYLKAHGKFQNVKKAAKCFQRSAEQGNSLGQVAFGLCRTFGIGVDKNPEDGDKYLGLAAKQNEPAALFFIAVSLQQAGDLKSMENAAKLFRKAADKGFAPAQVSYGWMLETGTAVKKNLRLAAKYYQMAVENEYQEAEKGMKRCKKWKMS